MRRRTPLLVFACIAVLLCAGPARAQFHATDVAYAIRAEQKTNLFVSWNGAAPLDGAYVDLPDGWTLRAVAVLGPGYAAVPTTVRPVEDGHRYLVMASHTLDGAFEWIFTVEAGAEGPARTAWQITPLVRRRSGLEVTLEAVAGLAFEQPLRLDPPAPRSANPVLQFRQDGGDPLLLRTAALPDLGSRHAFTLAFWMQTTGLNEVVLSTWDGDEGTPYPLDLVVDAYGRLLFYQGQPGTHRSMRTATPVADGAWHHVAVTQDAETGWTRLFLDGEAADSMHQAVMMGTDAGPALALGGRVPTEDVDMEAFAYTGALDELTIRRGVQTPGAVRASMRRPPRTSIAHAQRGVVHLGFEAPVMGSVLLLDTDRAERIPSDLTFFNPLDDLRAILGNDGSVRLSWSAFDPATVAFVVERSYDGQRFEPVGEVDVEAGTPDLFEQTVLYHYEDRRAADRVVFYRVQQRLESGLEHASGMIKLGARQMEAPASVRLVGNFPNPFNPTTTIAYEVVEAQPVRLSVWDLAGQQVALLVDEAKEPGRYEVGFDAGDLPTGTYFVRLEAAGATQTHKIVLMK